MNTDQLLNEIRSYCSEHANEENIKKSRRYFKDEIYGYGLTTPEIRDLTKDLLADADLQLPIILETAPALLKSGMYEETIIILLLINGKGKQFSKDTFGRISAFYKAGITNWAHADTLGMYILPQFLKNEIVKVDDFSSWIISPHKFQRRCVPVTLIKHLKAHRKDDFNPYFEFIEPLMTDKEREVHQGTGWFLREAWKIQPEVTERFLLKWKDTAPRLIFQYATEKMTPEYKQRFKRRPQVN